MPRATVSFTEKDLERLDKLKDSLDLTSISQTISVAIKLTDEIRKHKIKGGDVVFAHGKSKKELIFPGFDD